MRLIETLQKRRDGERKKINVPEFNAAFDANAAKQSLEHLNNASNALSEAVVALEMAEKAPTKLSAAQRKKHQANIDALEKTYNEAKAADDALAISTPFFVYYYPRTPRNLSDATSLAKECGLIDDNFGYSVALLSVLMLDEQGARLVNPAEVLPFMASSDQSVIERIALQIGAGLNVDDELTTAKKP